MKQSKRAQSFLNKQKRRIEDKNKPAIDIDFFEKYLRNSFDPLMRFLKRRK